MPVRFLAIFEPLNRALLATRPSLMKQQSKKIFVAGHESLLGAALVREIAARNELTNLIKRTPQQLDLSSQAATRDFLMSERPSQVYLTIGHPGSWSSEVPQDASESLHAELMTGINLIDASYRAGVKRLVLLGSACAYPANAPAPMAEEDLLSGKFNAQTETRSIAVIASLKLCESYNRMFGAQEGISYRCLLSATPFGRGARSMPQAVQTIPTMIGLIHGAKQRGERSVTLPFGERDRQEFLFAEDAARAAMCVMDLDTPAYNRHTQPARSFLNAGYGSDVTHASLAHSLAGIIRYSGNLSFAQTDTGHDRSNRLDSFRLRSMGWRPQLQMEDALAVTYFDFLSSERKQVASFPSPVGPLAKSLAR
jgi:GDP-L-fucose synthase